jgi:hypothetical protein
MKLQSTGCAVACVARVALSALVLATLFACGQDNDLTGPTPAPTPAVSANVPALISPAPGGSLCGVCSGTTWRFVWSAVPGATHYDLEVLDPNGRAFIHQERLGGTSFAYYQQTIMFGSSVHGWTWRVRAEVSGEWQPWSAAQPFEIDRAAPVLVGPVEGAVMDNACTGGREQIAWHFDWRNCLRADRYHLVVRHRGATRSVIDENDLTRSEFGFVSSGVILGSNLSDWVWRVRAQLGGKWGEWSPERTFSVEPANADCR